MDNITHILKLSVGTEAVEDLAAWQASARARGADGLPRHVTRMWPKREAEILGGGSLYWVIKGVILCRQRILRLDEVTGSDGIRRCAFVLDPNLIRTNPATKRPFQGWRYLRIEDAPPDLEAGANENSAEIAAELARMGLL